jgi:hypothetical protein
MKFYTDDLPMLNRSWVGYEVSKTLFYSLIKPTFSTILCQSNPDSGSAGRRCRTSFFSKPDLWKCKDKESVCAGCPYDDGGGALVLCLLAALPPLLSTRATLPNQRLQIHQRSFHSKESNLYLLSTDNRAYA